VALPETPQTREEAYLNAVATGDTSGIPTAPQTREEQYLDYIAKNGGGGGGGGGGGVFPVTATLNEDTSSFVLDKTAGEILNAFKAKQWPVAFRFSLDESAIDVFTFNSFSYFAGVYYFWSDLNGNEAEFSATSLSEYPTFVVPEPPGN